MNLSKIWITRKDFKVIPATKQQTIDFLTTIYKMEVESKNCEYHNTESVQNSIERIAAFLCGETYQTGLLLCGYVGNGKSTMLKSIKKLYSYLASEGYIETNETSNGFEFIQAKDLAFSLIDNRSEYERYKTCRMLIIDDVGEEPTEVPVYGVNFTPIKDILMYRYENRLLTLISSNLNPTKIKEKYHDERLTDRMKEMFYVIIFSDKSFRV